MAIFHYHELPLSKGVILQVSLASGIKPLNLLGEKSPAFGVDLGERAMEKAFRTANADYLPRLNRLDPEMRSAVVAQAKDLASGRLYLVSTTKEGAGAALEGVTRLLEERGHRLVPRPKIPPLHVMQDADGAAFFAVEGAWALRHLNFFAQSQDRTLVKEFIPLPDSPLQRIVFEKPVDVKALALKYENFQPDLSIINHTPDPFLKRLPELEASRPYLVTGRRSVEFSLTHGNVADVAAALPTNVGVSQSPAAWLLRGSRHEQLAAVEAVKGLAKISKFRASYVQDIPETAPEQVYASDARVLNTAIVRSQATTNSEIYAQAAAFKLKTGALTPQQVEGVAFMAELERSLLGDETGGGKSLSCASAAELKTPPGQKTLIVCPPGLIAQWIRAIDKFIPLKDGPPPLESSPEWMKRLPAAEREALAPAWDRVGRRFVFAPESALSSKLCVRRGKLDYTDGEEQASQIVRNAKGTLERLLKEPVATVIIDETQGMRVGGGKFELVHALAGNKLAGNFDIQSVMLASATPLHRDAPDLFAIFRLLDIPKFRKMDIKEFCETCCQRKLTIGPEGRSYAPPVAPYGYGSLKEEMLPTVADVLSERMLARSKSEIAPGRSRPKHILTPVPYEPSPKFGISIPGFQTAGHLLTPTPQLLKDLNSEAPYVARRKALADFKVSATIADVQRFLETTPPDRKLVVFSQFIETAEAIAERLMSEKGIAAHVLSSARCLNAERKVLPTKQDVVDDFIECGSKSRILVATAGAGGTGIDGLHRVARDGIINDFTVIPGVMTQAEGRVWRIEDNDLGENPEPVKIKYQVVDHPAELRDYASMLERRHEQEFVRQQGMIQALNSPDTVAQREMAAEKFEERILGIVGMHSSPKVQDNTYLLHQTIADMESRQEDPNLFFALGGILPEEPPKQEPSASLEAELALEPTSKAAMKGALPTRLPSQEMHLGVG